MADKDWITPAQLAESMRIAREADQGLFRKHYMNTIPPAGRQCNHRSIPHRCPNTAKFVLKQDNREPEAVCAECLVPVLLMLRKNTLLLIEVL